MYITYIYVNAAWVNRFPKGFFGLSKVNLKGTKTQFAKKNNIYLIHKANWHNLEKEMLNPVSL